MLQALHHGSYGICDVYSSGVCPDPNIIMRVTQHLIHTIAVYYVVGLVVVTPKQSDVGAVGRCGIHSIAIDAEHHHFVV